MVGVIKMAEGDIVELKISIARIEEKLTALSATLNGFCERQGTLNTARQVQIDTLSSRLDLLESWRDKADGSLRVLTFISGAAITLSIGLAVTLLKHWLQI
jgi:hypothetical protein